MNAIILPRLILIGDRFTDGKAQKAILDAVRAGVRWVHLRDHDANEYAFESAAAALVERLKHVSPEIIISINTRLSTAREYGLHFHTGSRGPAVDHARSELGPTALIGFSAHDLEEGENALRRGADYLLYSPIFDTGEKAGVGITELHRFCSRFENRLPVFALGGVTPEREVECLEAGAFGVAVLSGIMASEDSAEAASVYVELLEDSR